jgi:hypothetical protein
VPGDKLECRIDADPENTTVIADLMSGDFNEPVRVVAFNTRERWADDVSRQIAEEIQERCDLGEIAGPRAHPRGPHRPNPTTGSAVALMSSQRFIAVVVRG